MVQAMIHIIIPVYRGLAETSRCIESALRSENNLEHRITIIDDCSPDPELSAYLMALPQNEKLQLLRNEQNLGFVATVNRGMELAPDADIVLLNSDTEVTGDWLDRLHRCACSAEDVGTVTPFSNNATICSYPKFCEDNALPEGWDVAKLDALFRQSNTGMSIEIPTAVGFCMYIRRSCLNAVGLFDVKNFGKGYGEENDFCMRASKLGWRHLLCADTFVFHSGGASFGNTQNSRKKNALDTLCKLHPSYIYKVTQHINSDPARPFRQAVDFMRMKLSSKPVLLHISQRIGGGTERHLQELCKLLEETAESLVLKPHTKNEVVINWYKSKENLELYFDISKEYLSLLRFLRLAGLSRVHFHHLRGFSEWIFSLPSDLGIPYDFTTHDYFTICPRITLTNSGNHYCGEPNTQGCDLCIKSAPLQGVNNITTWRLKHSTFLKNAERLFSPSRDTAIRFMPHVQRADLIVAPHPDIPDASSLPPPFHPFLTGSEPLRIAVLGALSAAKGGHLLDQCAQWAKQNDLPLQFHLIGYAYRNLSTDPDSSLTIHGAYIDEELVTLISQFTPHLIWFPAQCPETYSYTLSAALLSSTPIVAPNIGAFPERLANRPFTWICPWDWDYKHWCEFFFQLHKNNFTLASPVSNCYPTNPTHKAFDYRKDYLRTSATPQTHIYSGNRNDIEQIIAAHSFSRVHLIDQLILRIRNLIRKPIFWLIRTIPGLLTVVRIIPERYRRRINEWIA